MLKVLEAANRLACTNNLRQLGLALINYHDTFEKFPPGRVIGPLPVAGVPQPVTHGWGPFILPQIEQDNLAIKYRWDLHNTDPANQPGSGRRDGGGAVQHHVELPAARIGPISVPA